MSTMAFVTKTVSSQKPSSSNDRKPSTQTKTTALPEPAIQPVDKQMWEESLTHVLDKHAKVFTALKNR